LLGHCQQPVVPAMVAVTVCIALNDDGASVIKQHVLRHASEIDEGLSQASKPSVSALIGREPYPTGATVAKRGDKGQQGIAATPDVGEIRLHLLTWRRLEPNDGLGLLMLAALQKLLQLRDATRVSEFLDLTQQHGCRYPMRPGRLDTSEQIVLVG